MLMNEALYCPRCKNILEETSGKYICHHCTLFYPLIDGIPSFVDQNVTDDLDTSTLGTLFKIEQKHFWYIGRKEIILDAVRSNMPDIASMKMLEIGCGNGGILAYLKQNGINIEGGDISLNGLRFCRQRVGLISLFHIDALALPFVSSFDIIGLFDVLEHIDDDEKALSEINRALKPGGKILLTVPANKSLQSYFDVNCRHRRRYSKRELAAKLERNGFIIRKISFYMFFLFPVLAAVRKISDILPKTSGKHDIKTYRELKTVPVVNDIFLGLLRLEKTLLKYLNLPFGGSLLALAEKK